MYTTCVHVCTCTACVIVYVHVHSSNEREGSVYTSPESFELRYTIWLTRPLSDFTNWAWCVVVRMCCGRRGGRKGGREEKGEEREGRRVSSVLNIHTITY